MAEVNQQTNPRKRPLPDAILAGGKKTKQIKGITTLPDAILAGGKKTKQIKGITTQELPKTLLSEIPGGKNLTLTSLMHTLIKSDAFEQRAGAPVKSCPEHKHLVEYLFQRLQPGLILLKQLQDRWLNVLAEFGNENKVTFIALKEAWNTPTLYENIGTVAKNCERPTTPEKDLPTTPKAPIQSFPTEPGFPWWLYT
jgi:hypothetical protein